jgi:prevent-host-death family protein
MMAVGIRELKNNLSRYVRLVQDGEEVLVTDRGKVVAALVPPDRRSAGVDVPAALTRMARDGQIEIGAGNQPSLYRRFERVAPDGLAQQLLDETRGER